MYQEDGSCSQLQSQELQPALVDLSVWLVSGKERESEWLNDQAGKGKSATIPPVADWEHPCHQ